jgi:hypothetical protein
MTVYTVDAPLSARGLASAYKAIRFISFSLLERWTG